MRRYDDAVRLAGVPDAIRRAGEIATTGRSVTIRVLKRGDEAVLNRVAAGVFDDPLDPRMVDVFLADPRHHLVVALEDHVVIGFATGVHYVHPDKPAPELWINEVGVAGEHRGRGVGRAVLDALLGEAAGAGCREAWVVTHRSNEAATRLYAALGGSEEEPDTVLFSFALDTALREPADPLT